MLDADLLAARLGDGEAFGRLQSQLEPDIRRFVRRLIGPSSNEDDILQTIFIALYFNLYRIEPLEQFRPYLFRIARNCCYDELRARRREATFSLDEEVDEDEAVFFDRLLTTPSPEDATHLLMLHLEVKAAMDRLSEVHRQTLILYAELGLSYAEIASAMNTNVGTVKSRVFHAKRMLRGLLKPQILQAIEQEIG